MNNFIDWTEMELEGNIFELQENFADIPKRIIPLLSSTEDEFYSTESFPTIKNVMKTNNVTLPDKSVRYAVDISNEGRYFVRLQADEEAFTWEVSIGEEKFESIPVGVTPEIMLYKNRGKRLSQGEVNEIEDSQPEEIIEFILKELS